MTDRLSQLLDEATRNVPPPDLASVAWARGRARRRRAQLASGGASALALLLVLGSAVVLSDRRNEPPPQTSLPTAATPLPASSLPPPPQSVAGSPSTAPPPSTEATLPLALRDGVADEQTAPLPDAETYLPLTSSTLPERIQLGRTWPTLAQDPMDRAVALFQSGDDLSRGIVALGADGRLRTVDVQVDPGGDGTNKSYALTSNSLSADGRFAGFPQKDALITVDLTTGTSRRYDVPGVNEHLSWHPDGSTIFVSGPPDDPEVVRKTGRKGQLLDVATGRLTPTPARAWDTVFTDSGELVSLGEQGLARFDPVSGKRLSIASLGSEISASAGRPSVRGRWIAGLVGYDNKTSIVLVDLPTNKIERRLDLEARTQEGCCVTVGWLGSDTVLYQNEAGHVLGWNIVTGAVTRVTRMDRGAVVSAPRIEPAGTALVPPSASAIVQVAPAESEEAALPLLKSSLPAEIALRADAPMLADDRPDLGALALLQTVTMTGDAITGFQLFVLGSDQRVRRLGVDLVNTRDESGSGGPPLRESSLRPDGLYAAFAQPGEVVIVDITAGTSRRYAVPGLNESTHWLPGGELLEVTRTHSSDLLDLRTGKVTNREALWGLVDDADSAASVVQLKSPAYDSGGNPTGPFQILRLDANTWEPKGSPVSVDSRVASVCCDGGEIRSGLIAAGTHLSSTGSSDSRLAQNPEAIVVIDSMTGALTRVLAFGTDRPKRFGAVLGWRAGSDVDFQSGRRVLAWNVYTGAVTRLTEVDQDATVSLAQLRN